jgi:hypothetical protein
VHLTIRSEVVLLKGIELCWVITSQVVIRKITNSRYVITQETAVRSYLAAEF